MLYNLVVIIKLNLKGIKMTNTKMNQIIDTLDRDGFDQARLTLPY